MEWWLLYPPHSLGHDDLYTAECVKCGHRWQFMNADDWEEKIKCPACYHRKWWQALLLAKPREKGGYGKIIEIKVLPRS